MSLTEIEPLYSVFISILSDYISEIPTESLPTELDVSALTSIADAQQMSPILYSQIKIPELKPAFACVSYYSVNKAILLNLIGNEFMLRRDLSRGFSAKNFIILILFCTAS